MPTDTDFIDLEALATQHLPTASDGELVLDATSLKALWQAVSPDDDVGHAALEEAVAAQMASLDSAMHARSGGWSYHLKRGLVKTAVLAPIVTATLLSAGVTGLPAIILPLVLPFLFELEKTTLSRRNEELLVSLVRAGATTSAKSADELYQLLPTELKAEVNKLDFLDFIDALELTGHAQEATPGSFQLRGLNDAKLKITIH